MSFWTMAAQRNSAASAKASSVVGTLIALAAGLVLWAPAVTAAPAAGTQSIQRTPAADIVFHPHRAVYDISLGEASGSSGVTGLTGRMVYELTGSVCEGFTQNMRFVTEMSSENTGDTVNDLQTSSWENGDGSRLRFSSSQQQNSAAAEISQGDAVRKGNGIVVDLSKPKNKDVALPRSVYFPIHHANALIDAARRGEKLFSADLYDGGEKGEKYYATLSIIGAGRDGFKEPEKVKGDATKLKDLRSWPVTMSYFDPAKGEADQLPVYELAFQFYENGVTSELTINYGEFSIVGHLRELTFTPQTRCDGGAGGGK